MRVKHLAKRVIIKVNHLADVMMRVKLLAERVMMRVKKLLRRSE